MTILILILIYLAMGIGYYLGIFLKTDRSVVNTAFGEVRTFPREFAFVVVPGLLLWPMSAYRAYVAGPPPSKP